jgi:hypothetical protein
MESQYKIFTESISKKAKKKLDNKTVQLKTLYSNHNKKISRI